MTEQKKEETATQRLAKRMTNKEAVPEARQTDAEARGEFVLNLGVLCAIGLLIALFLL